MYLASPSSLFFSSFLVSHDVFVQIGYLSVSKLISSIHNLSGVSGLSSEHKVTESAFAHCQHQQCLQETGVFLQEEPMWRALSLNSLGGSITLVPIGDVQL